MMEGTARKKTRKGKPGVSKNYGATQRNTLDPNSYLTYDILRIIFQYLDARDLGSAAMVCRPWSEAANKEKSIRNPCCFITPYTEREFLYKMKNIRIKPSIGFFFIPKNEGSKVNEGECTPCDLQDRIEDLLPEHCEAIMLYGPSIILDNDEMECSSFPSTVCFRMVCAFLPQIPNVRIKSFELAKHCVIQKSAEYQEIIKTIVDHEISERSTCFMLFWNDKGHTTAKRWASAMQKSKEVKIASVWGGRVDDIYVQRICKTKKRSFLRKDAPYCVAVLITGPIQTWSTILDEKCDTKEQVEARLKLFKDEVKLKKHSIGFMFACVARGTEMYKESNVESTIFKRLFPKVPLAGCFGYGEFGKTTTVDEVNDEKNDEEEHKCKKSKSWYNEYSTVFLILTYG